MNKKETLSNQLSRVCLGFREARRAIARVRSFFISIKPKGFDQGMKKRRENLI